MNRITNKLALLALPILMIANSSAMQNRDHIQNQRVQAINMMNQAITNQARSLTENLRLLAFEEQDVGPMMRQELQQLVQVIQQQLLPQHRQPVMLHPPMRVIPQQQIQQEDLNLDQAIQQFAQDPRRLQGEANFLRYEDYPVYGRAMEEWFGDVGALPQIIDQRRQQFGMRPIGQHLEMQEDLGQGEPSQVSEHLSQYEGGEEEMNELSHE